MTKEMLHQAVEETCLRMFGCELREATEKQAYRALCVTVRMMLEDKQRAFQAETREKEHSFSCKQSQPKGDTVLRTISFSCRRRMRIV